MSKQPQKIDYRQVGEVLDLIRELRRMGVKPQSYQIVNPYEGKHYGKRQSS